MNKKNWMSWSPMVLGAALLAVTLFDLKLVAAGNEANGAMLGREILLVVLGFTTCLLAMYRCAIGLVTRQLGQASFAMLGIVVFVACFLLGGSMGGLYLDD